MFNFCYSKEMRGFISIPILIIILVSIFGVSVFTYNQINDSKNSNTLQTSPTPTSSLTPTPTPTPVTSVKPSITTKATSTPISTPTPSPSPTTVAETPKTGCAEYNLGGDLGTLKVTIKPQDEKSLVGDASVKIYRKYPECPSVDPGFPLTQVIKQGSNSTNFSGMRPGPFKIDVGYHGNTSTHDVGISSGENSLEVVVSD